VAAAEPWRELRIFCFFCVPASSWPKERCERRAAAARSVVGRCRRRPRSQRHCGGAGAFLLCAWRRARTRPHPCAVCVCELELRRVARLPPTLPHDAPTGADMAPRLRQARSARGMRQLSAPMRGRCAHAASLPVCAHRPGTGLCRCLRRWHCSCQARSRPPSARLADAHASPRMPRLASESWASPLRLPLAGPTGRDARSWERRTGAVNGARACSRGGCEESPGQ
jgi:hypothetical protein